MIDDAAEALRIAAALIGDRATRQAPEPTDPRGQRVEFPSQSSPHSDTTDKHTGESNVTE